MKILQIISGSYPPSEGIGSHVYSISKLLVEQGHEVTVAIRRHDIENIKQLNDNGINYILIPIINIPFLSTILFGKALKNKFKHTFFDIVHFHSPLVPFVNLNTNKNILTIHSTMKVDTSFINSISVHAVLNKIMGKFLSPIFENLLIKSCDNIIVVCKNIKNELINNYGYQNLITHYIPNGIDENLFKNLNLDRKNQILYVGRLGYRKGIPVLLEAVKNIQQYIRDNEFNIVLCGRGKLYTFSNNFINQNKLNDILTITEKSQEEINYLYNESRFLIMNSTYETGPRTILEAIYTNTPFIATNVGLVDSINHEDFIIIKDFNTFSVEKAIQKAINSAPLDIYQTMSKNLDKYKPLFSNNKLTNEIIKIYEE